MGLQVVASWSCTAQGTHTESKKTVTLAQGSVGFLFDEGRGPRQIRDTPPQFIISEMYVFLAFLAPIFLDVLYC